jgi:hypothetical protein
VAFSASASEDAYCDHSPNAIRALIGDLAAEGAMIDSPIEDVNSFQTPAMVSVATHTRAEFTINDPPHRRDIPETIKPASVD